MCGRYQFSADEYKEIRQIVRDAQRRSEGNELNFPMAGDICPSQVAPVLVSRREKIVGEFQQWGLPGFRGRQQIINARAETVTEKPMFRRSVAFQRCVIPATGFYEWDSAKHKYFYLSLLYCFIWCSDRKYHSFCVCSHSFIFIRQITFIYIPYFLGKIKYCPRFWPACVKCNVCYNSHDFLLSYAVCLGILQMELK